MRHFSYVLFGICLLQSCQAKKEAPEEQLLNGVTAYTGTGAVTQGYARTISEDIFQCTGHRYRTTSVGEISDGEGKTWIVPAENQFDTAAKAFDLYNDCNDIQRESVDDLNLKEVPVVDIDSDGEVVTGYIFADNYFELYINGRLIGVDPVPFTPFNSNVVRFRVKRPYTIAVKLIDWEENLGLGSERNQGKAFHAGDGGFIASFSDGTVTGDSWKAQTYYIAPIKDLSCLSENGTHRSSANCSTEGVNDGSSFYGIHWPVPENWATEDFDDSAWPSATTYTEEVIGVDNKKAYMNFIEKFSGAGAQFIWSSNVILDNEVLVRYTVERASK